MYADHLEETFKPFPRQTAEEEFTPAGGRDESTILPVNLRELTNIIKTELNAKRPQAMTL